VRLELGKPVNCTDGPFGKLADVIIDPTKRVVTHLVVEPDGDGKARLGPIELASGEEGETPAIALRCSVEEAGQLDFVEETSYIRLGESPDLGPEWEMGVSRTCSRSRTTTTAPSAASGTKRCLPTTTRTCP